MFVTNFKSCKIANIKTWNCRIKLIPWFKIFKNMGIGCEIFRINIKLLMAASDGESNDGKQNDFQTQAFTWKYLR